MLIFLFSLGPQNREQMNTLIDNIVSIEGVDETSSRFVMKELKTDGRPLRRFRSPCGTISSESLNRCLKPPHPRERQARQLADTCITTGYHQSDADENKRILVRPPQHGVMTVPLRERLATWLLGEEGDVIHESEMQIVMVSTGIAIAGVFLVSPIVSTLAGTFGVSDAQAGSLVTAFTAPSIVLVPVAGVLADRYGRRAVLVGGLVIFGLAGVTISLTSSFTIVLGLRALQGVGYAAINPVGVALLGDLYDGGREATAQWLRVAGIQLLNLAAPLLAGALVLAAWQYPFLLYGFALVVAAWAWRDLPSAVPGERTTLWDYAADLAVSLRDPVMLLVLASFLLRFSSRLRSSRTSRCCCARLTA